MRGSEYSKAIQELKMALEGRPDFVPLLRTLGEAYQMNGKDKEALTVFKKALRLDEEDKATEYLLGLSYENLGQYGNAIRLFKRLAALGPVKNEVYYHLGISYGRQKKLAPAHYYFGLYFRRLGQLQKARFHFEKSKKLSSKNPSLRKKIQKELKMLGEV
jgi:tetratricopeptide (TPR) repeat protein